MALTGKLYLIPSPLGDGAPEDVLPAPVFQILPQIRRYVVEEVRTARRFLSSAGLRGHIEELEFHTLNEHTSPQEVEALLPLFEDGAAVGLISEAGLPAVADPGARLVALCHRHGIEVVPFVGPSSLMMALMSSGLDGQSFAFNGYIPVKPDERKSALKALEKRSFHQTQILIETPYRNDSLLKDMPRENKDNYYLTVFFDGDQKGAPMYLQLHQFPGYIMLMVGTVHAVG